MQTHSASAHALRAQPVPILFVAGEASGDHHGADVMEALKKRGVAHSPFGIGGRAMRDAGLQCVAPAEAICVAGLTEVLGAMPRIWGILRQLTHTAQQRRPKVAVLIDLPDFNLPLAKRLKRLGVYVIYYISPQLWAWRPNRIDTVRQVVDEMLVILPFEEEYYRTRGVQAHFVGHPLLEQITGPKGDVPTQAEAQKQLGLDTKQGPLVAILPGSRRLEVQRHLLPLILGLNAVWRLRPDVRGILPLASTIERSWIGPALACAQLPITVVDEQATLAIAASDVATVCSGTATLQTALVGRAMVVVYRVSPLSYLLLRRLVRVPSIALVNLIAQEPLVPELIQHALSPAAVAHHVLELLDNEAQRAHLATRFAQIKAKLGSQRPAASVAARIEAALQRRSVAPQPG